MAAYTCRLYLLSLTLLVEGVCPHPFLGRRNNSSQGSTLDVLSSWLFAHKGPDQLLPLPSLLIGLNIKQGDSMIECELLTWFEHAF